MAKLLYVDLGKKATDLLTKDFPDKSKVEINTRASNGVQFQLTGTRNHDGSILGSVQPKYTWGTQALTFSTTIDTAKVVKAEATIEKFPGLKITLGGNSETESVKADLEWKHERATVTTGLDLLSPKGTKASATVALHHEGISLGASTEYLIADRQEVTKLDGVLAYTTSDLQLTAYAKKKGDTLGATYHQKVSASTSAAAEIAFDLHKSDITPKLTFGVAHTLDLVGTQVKGKFDTDGKLSLSYGFRLNPNVKLWVGSSVNTNNISASGNHSTGFSAVVDF